MLTTREAIGMSFSIRLCISLLFVFTACIVAAIPAFPENRESLLKATASVTGYSINTVKPVIDSSSNRDRLSLLIKVSEILNDPKTGINSNRIEPTAYFIYDKLQTVGLGFLYSWRFSSGQRDILRRWRDGFMQKNPADLFFAPSADEIIRSKAAFGCTHYARAFIAVVKALGLVDKPEDMRYVISCKADDYNCALEKKDYKTTINGHQFAMVKVNSRWIAINTSKSEITEMPEGFSPESCTPPRNIPVRFASYPGVVFLLRKIGRNYDDDCGDDSLSALMNISRSGDPGNADFKWNKFVNTQL